MSVNIKGKKALVIGGSGGIGRALSTTLAEEGVDLVIHGSSKTNKLEILKQELSLKTNVETIICDFDEFNSFTKYKKLIEQLKNTDILCVCYGPFLQKRVHETTEQEWLSSVFWNYTFPGFLVTSILPYMIEKKWGRILLFGGTRTESVHGYKTNAVYGGAKTALCSFIKSVAIEYGKFNIFCNGILPGFTKTEYISTALENDLKSKMPQNTLIETSEIAEAGISLIKHESLNGVLLNIDKGWCP